MRVPKCSIGKRHTWKPFGGIKENPGYEGIGGSAICHTEKCPKCEMIRQRVFGDVNINGNRNCGFTYGFHLVD